MPFTFSHPAAVLPLAYLPKKWLSFTGLVIGSITPDFEYFMKLRQNSSFSHTWGGVFWFDLPLALFLTYLFNNLVRDELFNNVPVFLNKRFSRFKHCDRDLNKAKDLAIVIISLLIGITSHIVWDKLTHKSIQLVDDQMEYYTVLWDANSVIGALIIGFTIWKMPKGAISKKTNILPFWIVVVTTIAILLIIYSYYADNIRNLAIASISGFLVGLIIASAVEKIKRRGKKQVAFS